MCKLQFNEGAFIDIAQKIADDYGMGGLIGGLYEDFARDILKSYLNDQMDKMNEEFNSSISNITGV